MLRKLSLISMLMGLFLIAGCNKTIKIPIGVIATEKFVVSDYVQNDAIFQAESSIYITGTAQAGVIMVATLLDENGIIVEQAYSDTLIDGIWRVQINTPEASKKSYSLKLSDSNDKFIELYDNIRFGEVWLILGNKIDFYEEIEEINQGEVDTVKSKDRMFFYNNQWVAASRELSILGYELLEMINNYSENIPLAVVVANNTNSKIYQWLSRDIINSRQLLKDYLVENNKYRADDEKLNENDMSYYYENYLLKNMGMSYQNIIWYQGISELTDIDNPINEYENIYSLMLYTVISDIESKIMNNGSVYIIQEPSVRLENVEKMRGIQERIANFFSKTKIIPTYDLNKIKINDETDEVIVDKLDADGLMERISKYIYQHINTPSLEKVIKIYNEEKEVVEISLLFANIEEFDNVDVVTGLSFYNQDLELVDLDYSINGNRITINLEKEVLNEETDEHELVLINLVKITYAVDEIIYDCNLKTDGIPVIPFEILLEKTE